MRIHVNLATRPFVELRPFFAKLRMVMGALALLALVIALILHAEHDKLAAATQQMDSLRHETVQAQQEKLGNEARMRQPLNAIVLDRAHFLNALFLRKSFSWTAVMMDLERVLPTGVQVQAIEPQITAEGDVVIRLRVSGDRDRAIQLVRNLERSARFLAPRLSNESSQTKEQAALAAQTGAAATATPGVEFDILANYNPLPMDATVAESKPADEDDEIVVKPRVKHARRPAGVTPMASARPGPGDGVVLKPFAPGPGANPQRRPASRPGGTR